MADRFIDPENNEPTEELEDILKMVIRACLDEAAQKMEAGEEIVPFTGLAVKENLFIEQHDYEDVEECFNAARQEVQGARGAGAYAFCYDGFIDVKDGQRDCIIAEGGVPGKDEGYAFGYLYDDEGINKEIIYIGPAPNFMAKLKLELEMEGSLDPIAAVKGELDPEDETGTSQED